MSAEPNGSTDYFALAADLSRAEAARVTAPAVKELPPDAWKIGYLRGLARSLAFALADAHSDMERAGVWHLFMEGSIAEGLACDKWTDDDWARVYAEARGVKEAAR